MAIMKEIPKSQTDDPQRAPEKLNGFPIEVFPKRLQTIANEFSTALQYHPDYVGLALLTAISAAIGNGFKVKVRNLHTEPSILWAVIVGKPGIGKTHVINHLFKPFIEIDDLTYDKFEGDMQIYESTENKGQKPKFYSSVLRDFTFEALAESNKANPKGCIVLSDEILSMTGNWNKYNKGSDEPYYLTLYSGLGISTSRKTQAPIHTKQSCVNIIGGIQPAKLRELLTKNRFDNGFADRFIFAFPDAQCTPWTEDQFQEDIAQDYQDIIRGIRALTDEVITIGFETDAWTYLLKWQKLNTAKANDLNDNNDPLAGTLKKWESYVCRFALQLQIMHTYCTTSKAPESISRESVISAIKLFDYFLDQSLKVFGLISRPGELDNLSERQLQLYKELPEAFTRAKALEIGKRIGIPVPSTDRYLKSPVYQNHGSGNYQKRAE